MSEPINDGGPAFPHSSQPLDAQGNPMCGEHSEWGMTLRDWFAGQALVAIPHIGCGADLETRELAEAAYQVADAMIEARERKAV